MSENVYKYWYEFLKRSERYQKCCSRGGTGDLSVLYQDFGDVHALTWSKWWKKYKNLFSHIEPLSTVDEIKTKRQFENLFEEGEDDLLALVVNLHAPKDKILKKIDAILTRLKKKKLKQENALRVLQNPNATIKKKQGRPTFDPSFYHRYGLTPVPSSRDVMALGLMLKVYDACLLEDAKLKGVKKKKRYEIGEELGIIVPPIDSAITNEQDKENVKKEIITATVCRYNRWAKEIIQNAELGIFPKHS